MADAAANIRRWFEEVWNRSNLAVHGWNNIDMLSLLAQLGIVQRPGH